MNALQFIQRLPLQNDPCPDAFDFCENRTIAEAWNECRRPDWMLTILGHIATIKEVKQAKSSVITPILRHYASNEDNLTESAWWAIDSASDPRYRPATVVTHFINWCQELPCPELLVVKLELSMAADRIRACFTSFEIEQMCARYESK